MAYQHRTKTIPIPRLLLLLCIAMISAVQSQTIVEYEEAMDSALKAADFEEAMHHGRRILEFDNLSKKSSERAFHALAISFFHTAQLDSSRQHFLNLLSINENASLDPIRTSPKILRFFEDVRKNFQSIKRVQQPQETTERPITTKEIVAVPDIRPSAGVRSLFLTGLGQWQKGHKTRAILFAGAVTGLVGATAFVWLKEQDAKEAYDTAKFFPEINQRYNTYNDRQKNRKTLLLATGLTWGLTVLDAFRSPYLQPTIDVDSQSGLQTGLRLQVNLR